MDNGLGTYAVFIIVCLTLCITCYYFVFNKSAVAWPKIIFQTWKSKTDIPKNMRYWSETWKSKHPDYKYVLWDDADNRAFVKERFPWFLQTYDAYDVEIKRADAIRYMFLYTYGGIYVDMDFECLKPLDDLLEENLRYDILLGSIESSSDSWHLSNSIPNAIMISKPANNFWIRLLEEMESVAESRAQSRAKENSRVEEETGPVVLKEVYDTSWLSNIRILAPSVLYPISWITDGKKREESLMANNLTSLTQSMKIAYPSSYAVTYWTHSW